MKKFMNNLGRAFSNFFKSIGQDLTHLFREHWCKMLGYFVMFFVPLIYLVATYIMKKPESWAVPIFVWIPIVVMIIVYWCKIRSYLAVKVQTMKVENDIQAGKHAGAIIIVTIIQMAMTVAPFVIGYFVFDMLEKSAISVRDIFLILSLLEGSGALLVVMDTIYSVGRVDELQEGERNE